MEKQDQEIVTWIAEHTGDEALANQIANAVVSRRDYMRTGFFIYFDVAPDCPLISAAVRPVCPDIVVPGLKDGAGTALFLRNGKLHYLEIYARGGFFPKQLDNYRLMQPE